jgi:hypothetical protein
MNFSDSEEVKIKLVSQIKFNINIKKICIYFVYICNGTLLNM